MFWCQKYVDLEEFHLKCSTTKHNMKQINTHENKINI